MWYEEKWNWVRQDSSKGWRWRLGFALKVTFEQDQTEAREWAIWIIRENVMLEKVIKKIEIEMHINIF